MLQQCCEDIEDEIMALTVTTNDSLSTCADETFVVLTDLSKLTKDDDELIELFTQNLRADYATLIEAGEIELVATGIDIPELPENCDADSQAALDALKLANINLGDCLTFKLWLEGEL